MTDKIHTLHAVAPVTTQEEIRTDVIAKLKEALARAESGDVDEVLIIMCHPGDNEWSNLSTATISFARWIGYLEITQHDWIAQFKARKDR